MHLTGGNGTIGGERPNGGVSSGVSPNGDAFIGGDQRNGVGVGGSIVNAFLFCGQRCGRTLHYADGGGGKGQRLAVCGVGDGDRFVGSVFPKCDFRKLGLGSAAVFGNAQTVVGVGGGRGDLVIVRGATTAEGLVGSVVQLNPAFAVGGALQYPGGGIALGIVVGGGERVTAYRTGNAVLHGKGQLGGGGECQPFSGGVAVAQHSGLFGGRRIGGRSRDLRGQRAVDRLSCRGGRPDGQRNGKALAAFGDCQQTGVALRSAGQGDGGAVTGADAGVGHCQIVGGEDLVPTRQGNGGGLPCGKQE